LFVGGGSVVATGFSETRDMGIAGIYVVGGSIFQGSGEMVIIGCPNADNYGLLSIAVAGLNWWLGGELLG
jgi:hypothetical protein